MKKDSLKERIFEIIDEGGTKEFYEEYTNQILKLFEEEKQEWAKEKKVLETKIEDLRDLLQDANEQVELLEN